MTNITAVLDTNVLMNIWSCFDITKPAPGNGSDFLRNRTRDALILTEYLSNIRATTWSAGHEYLKKMSKGSYITISGEHTFQLPKVDPDDIYSPETRHHVLLLEILGNQPNFLGKRWRSLYDKSIEDITPQEFDNILLEYSIQHNICLITNEGLTSEGIKLSGLRKKAKERGGQALTPREYFEGKLDETAVAKAFIEDFNKKSVLYLKRRGWPEPWTTDHRWIHKYYNYVFYGEEYYNDFLNTLRNTVEKFGYRGVG